MKGNRGREDQGLHATKEEEPGQSFSFLSLLFSITMFDLSLSLFVLFFFFSFLQHIMHVSLSLSLTESCIRVVAPATVK